MVMCDAALVLSSKARQGSRVTSAGFLQEASESWQEVAEGTKEAHRFCSWCHLAHLNVIS